MDGFSLMLFKTTKKRHECRAFVRTTKYVFRKFGYLIFFSQRWFASVQDVLQADWQDVWHSPQPVFSFFSLRLPFTTVLICFISISLSACIVSRPTGENARREPLCNKSC
jgi:hypothetical protein